MLSPPYVRVVVLDKEHGFWLLHSLVPDGIQRMSSLEGDLRDDESDELAIGGIEMAHLLSQGTICVVGKLLDDHSVGKEIIKSPLICAWQPSERVTFKTLGTNLFLIEFENEWDKT